MRYYRIQPVGLGISGHRSLTSADETPYGIDVFTDAADVAGSDSWRARNPDDEVVVIESDDEGWDNEDVEGWRIDPEVATIVQRVSLDDWEAYAESLLETE